MMSGPDRPTTEYVIICVDDEPEVLAALVRDVETVCAQAMRVESCANADQVLELVEEFHAPRTRVPLIIADHVMPGMSGVELLVALHQRRDYRAMRKTLLSARTTLEDVTCALNHGALHRSLSKPWTREELSGCIRELLTSYFIHHAPEDMGRFPGLVDAGQLPRAYRAAEQTRQELDSQVRTLKSGLFADMDMSDEEVEQAMVAAIDEALDHPPRRDYPAGTVLLSQDQVVESVAILVSGYVELAHRMEGREIVTLTHSIGRIIGLLSLTQRKRAFYTCRTVTEVTVIPLTMEQLNTALQANPWLSIHFMTALIRSMGNRAKRMTQLKAEVEILNSELRGERDQLADALDRLEQAQMRLVESERMATLGQMAAGIAHELNNPIAGIRRSVDFIAEDVISLVMSFPEGEEIKAVMQSAMSSTPISTRELRKYGTALDAVVGDAARTRRLVKVGIMTPEAYKERFAGLSAEDGERRLRAIERYHELGTALRNVGTCSDRISEIVQSLRSYVRTGSEPIGNVDIHEGLEDTLRLFGHELHDVHVKRSYGDLPRIECRVGELNQVWTNLVSNALQAMGGTGELRVETDVPDRDHVRVRTTDSGKGIAPDVVGKVFDLHFTTKDGRVTFGLGMGLAICRQIITRHGGTISVESKPGETCFSVVLPVRFPRSFEEEAKS